MVSEPNYFTERIKNGPSVQYGSELKTVQEVFVILQIWNAVSRRFVLVLFLVRPYNFSR